MYIYIYIYTYIYIYIYICIYCAYIFIYTCYIYIYRERERLIFIINHISLATYSQFAGFTQISTASRRVSASLLCGESTRLAETRLAQNALNYLNKA